MDTKEAKKILETYSMNKNYYTEITTDLANMQNKPKQKDTKLHTLNLYHQTVKNLELQSRQTLNIISCIENTINALPQPSKSILYFKYVKHISYDRIADKMNYSVQRIYQLLNEALTKFAAIYELQLAQAATDKSLE